MSIGGLVGTKTKRVNFRRSEIEELLIQAALNKADFGGRLDRLKFTVRFDCEDGPHGPSAWVLIINEPAGAAA